MATKPGHPVGKIICEPGRHENCLHAKMREKKERERATAKRGNSQRAQRDA